MHIPFNRTTTSAQQLALAQQSIDSGQTAAGGGFTKRAETMLCQMTGAAHAMLTTSCTHALEMTALLLDIQPGDEVIVPSYTFVSSASAYALRGARIVFADCDPATQNLDPERLEGLITERTRAIVVVHYAGIPCDMEAIMTIADAAGVPVIEDNAHGLGGHYHGRPLGSFGRFATQSFHSTKNVSCGEGGALLLNNAADLQRAQIVRDKGTDRALFFAGQVDKYTWRALGASFGLSDVLAALLVAQLDEADRIQGARRALWLSYQSQLADWARDLGVQQPHVPDQCGPAWHLYYLMMPSQAVRDALLAHLKAGDISAVFHYAPLHQSPQGQTLAARTPNCPNSDRAGQCLLRLPLFTDMTSDEQARVIARILSFQPDSS